MSVRWLFIKMAVYENKLKQRTLGTTNLETGRGRERFSVDWDDRQLLEKSLNYLSHAKVENKVIINEKQRKKTDFGLLKTLRIK